MSEPNDMATRAVFHAIRADVLMIAAEAGLKPGVANDIAERGAKLFAFNSDGSYCGPIGETVAEWVSGLKSASPHYFNSEAPKPAPRARIPGRPGDGRAIERLELANGGAR